jgi:hypothetical protein
MKLAIAEKQNGITRQSTLYGISRTRWNQTKLRDTSQRWWGGCRGEGKKRIMKMNADADVRENSNWFPRKLPILLMETPIQLLIPMEIVSRYSNMSAYIFLLYSTLSPVTTGSRRKHRLMRPPSAYSIIQLIHYYIPSHDWFTARISSAALFADVVRYGDNTEIEDLVKQFQRLLQDDTPMVRRGAGASLKEVRGK